MPNLDIYHDRELFITFRLEADDMLIGRASDCDIRLPDQRVSRRHARIEADDRGRFWIEDFSTNGTRVNSALLEERRRLDPGSRIYIQDYTLVLEPERRPAQRYLDEEITGLLTAR